MTQTPNNRIDEKFRALRAVGRKAFIPFITAGYPSLAMTRDLVLEMERQGADIIELGVPFSDPLADGPIIQAASYQALQSGVTLKKILSLVVEIRRSSQVPIALMSYYNPIFHFGEERFVAQAQACGVDGLIVPDLPPEEAAVLIGAARPRGLATVFFVAPTTRADRLQRIVDQSTGFIYYVSVAGVTGARTALPRNLLTRVRQTKALTDKPVCVGFGVSSAEQVRAVAAVADGVIVGSAIIKEIDRQAGHPDQVQRVGRFVGRLAAGVA